MCKGEGCPEMDRHSKEEGKKKKAKAQAKSRRRVERWICERMKILKTFGLIGGGSGF